MSSWGDLFFFLPQNEEKKSSSTVEVGKIIDSKVWDGDICCGSLDSSWVLHLFNEDAYDGIIIWGYLKQEPQKIHSFHHNLIGRNQCLGKLGGIPTSIKLTKLTKLTLEGNKSVE